jgi:SAM-dependent methyltransferase
MSWRGRYNAEVYDRFVRERPIYSWLNENLVRLADLSGARRVLDLACGTGATTTACLRELSPRAEIVAVDASDEMLAVARSGLPDPRVRFESLPASGVDDLGGTFDRIVCNAAMWQFPAIGSVLDALRRRTRAGARLVFNVPAERVVGEPAPVHPFQIALLREIEEEIGRPLDTSPAEIDRDVLLSTANEHGFRLRGEKRRVYEGLQRELMQLMSIPALISPLAPGLTWRQRDAAWRRACRRPDPELRIRVPWVYFVFERTAEPSGAGAASGRGRIGDPRRRIAAATGRASAGSGSDSGRAPRSAGARKAPPLPENLPGAPRRP